MVYPDVMVDLEMLGLRSNAPILSIGAVQFNADTGEIGEAYYEKVEWIHDQLDRPLDRETVAWWLSQDPAAQAELIDREGCIKLKRALKLLDDFIPKDARIWANGITFDVVILDDAYQNQAKRMPPWGFRKARDCRTVKDAAETLGMDFKQFKNTGQSHNAVADCLFQIEWTCAAWQYITGSTRKLGIHIDKQNVIQRTRRPYPVKEVKVSE